MANDDNVLRLVLYGSATLPLYSDAVEGFTGLLDALGKEFASDPVDWIVESPEILARSPRFTHAVRTRSS